MKNKSAMNKAVFLKALCPAIVIDFLLLTLPSLIAPHFFIYNEWWNLLVVGPLIVFVAYQSSYLTGGVVTGFVAACVYTLIWRLTITSLIIEAVNVIKASPLNEGATSWGVLLLGYVLVAVITFAITAILACPAAYWGRQKHHTR